MTSVPNLLQRSNGNSYVLFLLIACWSVSACNAFKKVPRDGGKDNEELEEIQGAKVYNPKTGRWEYPTEVTQNMDTVQWRRPADDVASPITSDSDLPDTSGEVPPSSKKESYNIAVMLPFMTENFNDLSTRINRKSDLAIQFYGGMKMAFDQLSSRGVKLKISVHDTQASEHTTKSLLLQQSLQEADLIVGPVAKDNIKLVADFAKTNKKPMVSPLSPSINVTEENPWYLQVSPSLEAHCKAITRHALQHHQPSQIVLVCRDKKAETSRLKYFQEANYEEAGSTNTSRLKEFIVTSQSADYGEMDVKPYIQEGRTTVFIVPSWSNESFVYSLLRNISIAKGNNKVVVYGMPQWMKYEQISYDYYENLHLHVSSDSYIDSNDEDIKNFRRNFYYRYGTVPTDYAYEGFGVMQYFGDHLYRGGTQFQQQIDQNDDHLLHTRYRFDPVVIPTGDSEDYDTAIDRYENRYVNILQFKDYYFQMAE